MAHPGSYHGGLAVEVLVADLLRDEGFVILCQNYRFHHLEVDLIALDGDTLCFVEVKARSALYLLRDIDALIDARKRRNLILSAEHFVRSRPDLYGRQVRFDYALVHTPKEAEPHVRYIKNAFVPRPGE